MAGNDQRGAAQRRREWSRRFLAAASTTPDILPPGELAPHAAESPVSFIESFADERGHRRAVDRPFLSHVLGYPVSPTLARDGMDLDERLWWGVLRPGVVDGFQPRGPLVARTTPEGRVRSVEVWTETELCAQHALWHLSLRDPSGTLRDRLMEAARWCVGELQPDNATNHPWAAHVYAELAVLGDAESEQYAGTLVHNAMVSMGRPDRFSAFVLLDAGRALAAAAQTD